MKFARLTAFFGLAVSTCFGGVYSWDNGATNSSSVAQARGALLVGFQAQAGMETIGGLQFRNFWDVANGLPIDFYLWGDPTNDGLPGDAQVLRTVATTIDAPDNNHLWQTVQFASPVTFNVGDWFFVGDVFEPNTGFSYFLTALDQTGTSSGNSWEMNWNSGNSPDPNNLGSANTTYHFTSSSAPNGNLVIRALTPDEFVTASPEPSGALLLGGALLAGVGWRRRSRRG